MARSCVTDPRWRELVALYRYDWIAAADVLFGKNTYLAAGSDY